MVRTYENQRVHRLLNWRFSLPELQTAVAEMAVLVSGSAQRHLAEGSEGQEARREP
jgi:hypothetical protein